MNKPEPSVETKHYNFEDIKAGNLDKLDRKISSLQCQEMYRRTIKKDNPVILELGTRRGKSTTVFLQVCSEKGGHVYSVDIEDFSHIASDDNWTFILSDSVAIQNILKKHPELENGIDILLIDSLHKRYHVEKELYGWVPYLNQEAIIFLDDIDPHPYRKGNLKDRIWMEFDWQDMQDGVLDIFHANEDDYTMEIMYGSTGLGTMTKHAPKGTELKKANTTHRTYNCFYRLRFEMRKKIEAFKNKLRS